MTLTIGDDGISGERTAHTARLAPGGGHLWEVSWLPGRLLDRSSAITAMTLAEAISAHDTHRGHRLWPHLEGWAAELGLTAPDAITRLASPPGTAATGKDAAPERVGREAGRS